MQPGNTTVNTQLLYQLLEFSESLLQGDYSKRIHVDFEEDVLTKIADNLNRFADKLQFDPKTLDQNHEQTIETFIEVISSFTNLDFKQKLPISDNGTIFDAIATGINMLGDELASSTASKQELEEERNRLNEAQAIAKVGSWELATPFFLISLSKESRKIFELEADGICTWNTVKSKIQKDDVTQLEALMLNAIEARKDFSCECRMTTNGALKYIMCIGEVVFGTSAVALKGTFQDITERKRVEENLKEAKRLAEEANTAKSRFLANMSHEIRTPLNGILGLTEIMQMDDISQTHREYLDIIRNSGKTLSQLINDILDLSKIESGKLTMEHIPFDFEQLVDTNINRYKFLAQEKGIILSCTIDPEIPKQLLGDPTRISQIMTNLISNAIKFTMTGTIDVEFTQLKRENNKSVIQGRILDTGIGIPMDKADLIFESFTQADDTVTRKYGGSGLGLSIVKSLLRQMEGSITVKSPADALTKSGSEFTFVMAMEIQPQTGRTAPVKLNGRPRFSTALNILLVDDNPVNLLVAEKILSKLGASVTTAVSGEQAIEMVKVNSYDVVMMDIQMPGLDGHQASMEIRKLQFKRPIIALSANAYKDDVTKSLQAGMNDHIEKPFTEVQLFETISKHVNGSDDAGRHEGR
jgi:signal transduction histidine kinase/CheY-like chemotaxis protein